MELDMTNIVKEIVMQAEENQEEFIFKTIYPYCENILQMKINKEELKQILLNGMQKQQPCEDCISRLIVQEEITKSIALKENPHQMYKRIQAIPSVTPKADVLDEIRAKIEEYKSRQLTCAIDVEDLEAGKQIALEYVLAIIDKYKAENDKESDINESL